MITVRIGDLFSSECQTLVNTVNTVGIMGKGIAAEFKRRYPEMFRDYKRRCDISDASDPRKVTLGRPYVFSTADAQMRLGDEPDPEPRLIVNFPTKDHWRAASRLDAIEEGLRFLVNHHTEWGITSIAVPPLGCGHGGLDWSVVGPTLYRHLSALPIPVEMYAPVDTDPRQLDAGYLAGKEGASPVLTTLSASDLAVGLLAIDLYRVPGSYVNQTSLRSISYFAAAAGIRSQDGIDYTESGIRDEEYAGIRSRLLHNGILSERREGRAVLVVPGTAAEDARRVFDGTTDEWFEAMRRIIELHVRIGKLARIAPSVHWAARAQGGHAERVRAATEPRSPDDHTSRPEADVEVVVTALENQGFLP